MSNKQADIQHLEQCQEWLNPGMCLSHFLGHTHANTAVLSAKKKWRQVRAARENKMSMSRFSAEGVLYLSRKVGLVPISQEPIIMCSEKETVA